MKTCIIISGPTAVGKTAIAIALAKHFNTEIISADSRQCFRELNIGVAKPSPDELSEVHHYFINSHSITQTVSAADFETYALEHVQQIFEHNDVAVMVGGTGLYIKAFCGGLDPIPPVKENIRKNIVQSFEEFGIDWLKEQISEHDHAYYKMGEMQNPQRMMRALEVKLSTGNSITTFQTNQKVQRDFNIIQIGLELPRQELYDRINQRVDNMMAAGLLDEARELKPYRDLNALQTVGYKEMFSYCDEELSLNGAIELIKQNTRNYAKRQMTWFKKDSSISWLEPEFEVVKEYLKSRDMQ